MATPAQVANDLDIQAARLNGTGNDHLVTSCRRGANTIRTLLETVAQLEAATEAEAQKYERYMNGEDV